MYKFREHRGRVGDKFYSSISAKTIRGAKKATDHIGTLIENGKRASRYVRKGVPKSERFYRKPKSRYQLNRSTVKTGHQIEHAASVPVTQFVDKGLQQVTSAPAAIITSTGLTAAAPLVHPALAVSPTSVLGLGVEKTLRSKSSKYRDMVNKISSSYENSGLSRKLRNANSPSINQILGTKIKII